MIIGLKKLTALALAALLSWPAAPPRAEAQTLGGLKRKSRQARPHKIAPDLEELLADDDASPRQQPGARTLAAWREQHLARRRSGSGVRLLRWAD
jgi:hypothetical protein